MTSWSGRHVVLGVTGGIACYKSCHLVRRLTESGAQVDVVMTKSAAEFVRPVTFEALSGRPVLVSLWESGRALDHVRLGQTADLVVVAPASANFLARFALGLADDALTSLVLASTRPILIAPAMNDVMFAAETTQAHLNVLKARGVAQVGPEVGPLAEGASERPGRMSEPEVILAHAARLIGSPGSRLAGKRILVTAGPTREPLDPVRVMTNRSSGRMGFRIAEAAWARGASVDLVTGPSSEPEPVGVRLTRIETTAEMAAAVGGLIGEADVLVMAAAPADYRPADPAATKRPRQSGSLTLSLEPTDDILNGTRGSRKPGMLVVGFALETGDAIGKGVEKLTRKGLDLIVINDALEPGAGFEVDTNRVTIVDREGHRIDVPLESKAAVADRILDAVEARLG